MDGYWLQMPQQQALGGGPASDPDQGAHGAGETDADNEGNDSSDWSGNPHQDPSGESWDSPFDGGDGGDTDATTATRTTATAKPKGTWGTIPGMQDWKTDFQNRTNVELDRNEIRGFRMDKMGRTRVTVTDEDQQAKLDEAWAAKQAKGKKAQSDLVSKLMGISPTAMALGKIASALNGWIGREFDAATGEPLGPEQHGSQEGREGADKQDEDAEDQPEKPPTWVNPDYPYTAEYLAKIYAALEREIGSARGLMPVEPPDWPAFLATYRPPEPLPVETLPYDQRLQQSSDLMNEAIERLEERRKR